MKEKLLAYLRESDHTVQEIRAYMGLKGLDALNELMRERKVLWDGIDGLYKVPKGSTK